MTKKEFDPDDERRSTSEEAIEYTNNEILWSRIYLEAWKNTKIRQCLEEAQKEVDAGNPDAVNELLVKLAGDFKLPKPSFLGMKTKLVFDTPRVIHLRVPAVENMPRSPVAMVPYNI